MITTKNKNIFASVTMQSIFYVVAVIVSLLMPVALYFIETPWLGNTHGKQFVLYEYFGFSTSLALIFILGFEFLKDPSKTIRERLPFFIFIATSFHFLQLIAEYSFAQSYDYLGYENGAKLVLQNLNPYEPKRYAYPPLMALVMAKAYLGIDAATSWFLGGHLTEASLWNLVYYFYQTLQFWMIPFLFLLCCRFLKGFGKNEASLALLISFVLIVSSAMMRTLRHNQVNLWVLNLTLGAILLTVRFPFLAGILVALATHIKIYPVILGLPWLVMRNFRALTGLAAGLMIFFLFQTDMGSDLTLWMQYFEKFSGQSHANDAFRDNSLHSLSINFLTAIQHVSEYSLRQYAKSIYHLAALACIAWMSLRMIRREKIHHANKSILQNSDEIVTMELHVRSQMIDVLALMFLVSPLVWEHHYVMAIPIIIWMLSGISREVSQLAVLGVMLILLPPTFDFFPISYHRLAGLLLLIREFKVVNDSKSRQIRKPEVPIRQTC